MVKKPIETISEDGDRQMIRPICSRALVMQDPGRPSRRASEDRASQKDDPEELLVGETLITTATSPNRSSAQNESTFGSDDAPGLFFSASTALLPENVVDVVTA